MDICTLKRTDSLKELLLAMVVPLSKLRPITVISYGICTPLLSYFFYSTMDTTLVSETILFFFQAVQRLPLGPGPRLRRRRGLPSRRRHLRLLLHGRGVLAEVVRLQGARRRVPALHGQVQQGQDVRQQRGGREPGGRRSCCFRWGRRRRRRRRWRRKRPRRSEEVSEAAHNQAAPGGSR